jgi:hypothetical protein
MHSYGLHSPRDVGAQFGVGIMRGGTVSAARSMAFRPRRQARYRALHSLQIHQTHTPPAADSVDLPVDHRPASVSGGRVRCRSVSTTRTGGPSEAEFGAVAPHRVQNDRQLAGHGNDRFPVSALALDLHSPRLQDRPFLAARQQSARRLVERRAHLIIALARDPPIPIDAGSGLIPPGRQPKIRTDIARSGEAGGVVDRGSERQRHHWTDPGNSH